MDVFTDSINKRIIELWENYNSSSKISFDTKGKAIEDIDSKRISAIASLQLILDDFLNNKIGIREFKTAVDSFNKQNNLWGFTSVKGQMFFNLLVKSSDSDPELNSLTSILRRAIIAPSEINDAMQKIKTLESFCKNYFTKALDKRKAPNPNSAGYFLSYFWQIQDYKKWPVMYSSILSAWEDIGLWKPETEQARAYHAFFLYNHEIKEILSKKANHLVGNWEVEHVFWNFKPVTAYPKKDKPIIDKKSESQMVVSLETLSIETVKPSYKASFELEDYLIPKVAKLIELGSQSDKSAAGKGYDFEKLVAEIFKQLDFDVEALGQGKGRQPDIIAKFREENTAFLVDAKAYFGGYSLGTDDRAIKEYISHHCPKLQKEGYKKIGFIIVSNSFKSNFDSFINEVTWNTEIKRFILLTSEALLYLLAYKTKDKLSLSAIIESLVGSSNLITAQDVIEEFDDF